MAQVATMGPPLSPRETRRSGRRAPPSLSASTSKSPDSPSSESAPRSAQNTTRPSLPTTNGSGRNKRSKQEEIDEPVEEPLKNGTNGSTLTNGNGRAKRKGKEKEKPVLGLAIDAIITKTDTPDVVMDVIEPEEEQGEGVTRCVCGSTGEDDADAGEFMVQCETCNSWQHGLCMGYESEDQLPKDDYHCEQCRPDLHVELLKKLSRRPRHSSANSHQNSSAPRTSRSHSPSHLLKPAKRRNTMNSRDAAYDEKLKEIIEATAAEAAAANQPPPSASGSANGQVENEEQVVHSGVNGRKKRKRTSDDGASVKRTRSASTTSDRPTAPVPREETPAAPVPVKTSMPAPAPKVSNSRNRRGGGRKSAAQAQDVASVDGDDGGGAASNRRANNSRAKTSSAPTKRGQASANTAQEHGSSSRRNYSGGGPNGTTTHAPNSSSSRAYHNSHAYVVSQQPLLSSWGLPDYLAHLEPMLPTNTPRPLQVRGSGLTATGRESMERTMERGVKVKWPSKRMSVGDMNKRVRALVEWVGREQANALEHGRRRDALEAALRETAESTGFLAVEPAAGEATAEGGAAMAVDGALSESPVQEKALVTPPESEDSPIGRPRKPTMKMMEELMEELIGFQERFGPGAKSKERERRVVTAL